MGSSCQAFGQTLGSMVSGFMFIFLHTKSILTISTFVNFCGIFIISVTIIIALFEDEVNPKEDDDMSFFTMIIAFKGFLTNKNLLLFLFNDVFWRLG